jgi:predicted TIM-barrel fold metal-dependent hydrolase
MFDDEAFALACAQAYNDFLIEEWAAVSSRFVPQCIIPVGSGDVMATEIRRAVGMGHKGVIIPAAPSLLREDGPMLNDPCFGAVWSACEELDVPVCFHAGASEKLRMPTYKGYTPALAAAYRAMTMPQSGMSYLSNFLVSGILEQHRNLKAIFSGASAGLITFVLETTEYLFDSSKNATLGYSRTPTEMFRDQCYAVAIYDEKATLTHACEALGVNNILWGTEFPFSASTWPDTQARLRDALADLPSAARAKLAYDNTAAIYAIEAAERIPVGA